MGTPRKPEDILRRALDYGLLDERQFQEVWAAVGTRQVPLEEVKKQLLRGGYMTNYQFDRLAKGERTGFFCGPYKMLYAVGAGTFARVFRAVHRQTGEIVALKVLRNAIATPTSRETSPVPRSFCGRAKLGLTLRHPNIVPIYDVAVDGASYYIVMEFIEGWSLDKLVKICIKIKPLQATQVMMEMVEGLHYAFEHGLTHRDLKLNNVLVTSSGQAKLVDFGLATSDDSFGEDRDNEMPNTRTIDYAALERATGMPRTTPAATSTLWAAFSITCSLASRRCRRPKTGCSA